MKLLKITFFTAILALFSCETDLPGEGQSSNRGGSNFSYNNSYNGDSYTDFEENQFVDVNQAPTSTFSVDADGASYSNVRRFISEANSVPPKNAVRTEELINYFDINYAHQATNHPVSVNGEISSCPWDSSHQLIRIGLKGQDITSTNPPASNFVFLIDRSGSMSSPDKLDFLKTGLKTLIDQLDANDRVSIVTYSGSTETIAESVSGDQKVLLKGAIDQLTASGYTNGGDAIIRAYKLAEKNFITGGNNRIILGTDGDLNVGITSREELIQLIEEKREQSEVYLTVLGLGRGNLNEGTLEQIADKGNGNYEYIDKVEQLDKIFIHDFNKFFTVAKDVKVQVEFNSQNVSAYRLIGYENRSLTSSNFDNDSADAGEIGSNQSITALYEIVPKEVTDKSLPFFFIKFRYKALNSNSSELINLSILDQNTPFTSSSQYMQFTASVAAFGMLLRDSKYSGTANYSQIKTWLENLTIEDKYGYKSEFSRLVQQVENF